MTGLAQLVADPLGQAAPTIPAVDLLSAEKVFANGVRGLSPISLTLQPGEFLSLIGPSGC